MRSPPVKKLINFEEANLPLAMGCLKSENTVTDNSSIVGISFVREISAI